jgi:cupin domain
VRRLTTGIDARGRSCLVEESAVAPLSVEGFTGLAVAELYSTDQSPPPARPPGHAQSVDVRLAPGFVRWMVVEHEPHEARRGPTTATTMHHSDALDLILVERGNVELMLEDGVYELGAGDCVVMPGVDHALKAGPDGCRMVVVAVGTLPPG